MNILLNHTILMIILIDDVQNYFMHDVKSGSCSSMQGIKRWMLGQNRKISNKCFLDESKFKIVTFICYNSMLQFVLRLYMQPTTSSIINLFFSPPSALDYGLKLLKIEDFVGETSFFII